MSVTTPQLSPVPTAAVRPAPARRRRDKYSVMLHDYSPGHTAAAGVNHPDTADSAVTTAGNEPSQIRIHGKGPVETVFQHFHI